MGRDGAPYDGFEEARAAAGLKVFDRATLPARPARLVAVPAQLDGEVRAKLEASYPGGLYAHPAAALAHTCGGRDLCLATPTASGKSLVFMAAVAHAMATKSDATALALYPARALIQDQLGKWQDSLAGTGRRAGTAAGVRACGAVVWRAGDGAGAAGGGALLLKQVLRELGELLPLDLEPGAAARRRRRICSWAGVH